MVIICVGPDCAGKTSMIKSLVEINAKRLSLHKVSPPFTEEQYDGFVNQIEEQLRDKEHDIIWDRNPLIDAFVYPHAMDSRKSYYEVSGQEKRIKELLQRCVVIYIHAEAGTLIERADAREDGKDKYLGREIQVEDLNAIMDEYVEVFRQLEISSFGIDTTHMSKALAEGTLEMIYNSILHQPKTAKMAHIVPRDSLYMTSENQYHMCLAQMCRDEIYKSFFRKRASEGKFVLLDNGAAEGEEGDMAHLFDLAAEIGASEVILPDKLMDMETTLEMTERAFSILRIHNAEEKAPFRIMIVPQGMNFNQWKECAAKMVELYPDADSFGVPKALVTAADPYARYYAVEYLTTLLAEKNRRAEIHLLGMNEPPAVVRDILESFPMVRGIDSAFAYLCTQALVPISHPYVERPSGTIDFINGKDLGRILDINLQLLSMNINRNQNDVDYTWNIR